MAQVSPLQVSLNLKVEPRTELYIDKKGAYILLIFRLYVGKKGAHITAPEGYLCVLRINDSFININTIWGKYRY